MTWVAKTVWLAFRHHRPVALVDQVPNETREATPALAPKKKASRASIGAEHDLAAAREQQQRLFEQVVALRAQFQESIACYSVRVQGLLAMTSYVLDEDLRTCTPAEQLARASALRMSTERINALKVKPSRGRRRDLKAIEKVADELTALVAEW